MLKIFNDLEPFFNDCYRRINVREYARIRNISPPTASTLLESLKQDGLLNKEEDRGYNYYFANKESKIFIDLSRNYWYQRFKEIKLTEYFDKELIAPLVILFGSLSKAEVNENSDIDIAIFTSSKKELHLEKFKKKLKRKIQVFVFKNENEVKNKDLLKNIHNGFIISGAW